MFNILIYSIRIYVKADRMKVECPTWLPCSKSYTFIWWIGISSKTTGESKLMTRIHSCCSHDPLGVAVEFPTEVTSLMSILLTPMHFPLNTLPKHQELRRHFDWTHCQNTNSRFLCFSLRPIHRATNPLTPPSKHSKQISNSKWASLLFSQFYRMVDRVWIGWWSYLMAGFWWDFGWVIGGSGRDFLSSDESIEKDTGDPGVLLSSFSHARVQVVNCG